MNYTSDELFNRVHLENETYFSEYERHKIVEDLNMLQELLHPYGILKDNTKEKLMMLGIKSLVSLHTWQNELFAIKHFRECGKNLPTQNIFGVYTD